MRIYDVAVVAWIVFWVVVAVLLAVQIDSLRGVTVSIAHTAEGLRATAKTLEGLSHIPFVGGSIGDLVRQIDKTAATAVAESADARATIGTTALLVGIGVGVGQGALGLLLYLPVRLAWRREVAAVRRALAAEPGDAGLGRHLARRALEGMSYEQVRAWDGDPWRQFDDGDVWPLAELELRRLGLSRPM